MVRSSRGGNKGQTLLLHIGANKKLTKKITTLFSNLLQKSGFCVHFLLHKKKSWFPFLYILFYAFHSMWFEHKHSSNNHFMFFLNIQKGWSSIYHFYKGKGWGEVKKVKQDQGIFSKKKFFRKQSSKRGSVFFWIFFREEKIWRRFFYIKWKN